MQLITAKDYETMSQMALTHVQAHMYTGDNRRVNLSITAGKTPERLYQLLTEEYKGNPCFKHVHFYNFDEIPREGEETGVTMNDLIRMFFDPAEVPRELIHVLDTKNWKDYDKKLKEDGGLDMLIMGLGTDGHFCGNLAGTVEHFGMETRMVTKEKYPISYFERETSPDHYVTFGPKTVMNARHLIMIINGSHKAEIAKKALFGPVTPEVPASVFQLHPNYTVIMDEEAASLLDY